MMDISDRLLQIKSKLESAAARKERLIGEGQQLKQRLEEEFGIHSLKEARDKLGELSATIKKMEAELVEKVEELEKEMGDNG